MKLSKENLPNILVAVAAVLLLGFALWSNSQSKQTKPGGFQNAADLPAQDGSQPNPPINAIKGDGPSAGDGVAPDSKPGQSLPKDTLDKVTTRIDEAPNSKYSKDRKQVLKALLGTAKSINLTETTVFDVGAGDIGSGAKRLLKQSWENRKTTQNLKNADFFMVLIGYASPDGGFAQNLRLAEDRAEKVAEHLVREYGVADKKLLRVAVGQTKLLDSNDTRNNRAVEIWEVKINPDLVDAFR